MFECRSGNHYRGDFFDEFIDEVHEVVLFQSADIGMFGLWGDILAVFLCQGDVVDKFL